MKNKQDQSDHATWEDYARFKALYKKAHPDATCEEYDEAIRLITWLLGI